MKKYRLGYDYVFIASKPFTYQGDDLLGLSIDVLFMVFDKKGNEIFFESEELSDQKFNFGNENLFYLSDVINCSFDTKKILDFKPNFEIISKIGDYVVQYKIDSYYKDIKGEFQGFLCAEPTAISKDDFMDITKNNIEIFNNPDNYQAQSTAYFTQEVITQER